MKLDLRTLPPGAAHAVEAWRRAEHAVPATAAHWRDEAERIYAALTPRAAVRAAEVIAAIRAGAEVIERSTPPAPKVPAIPLGGRAVRVGGEWRWRTT